MGRLEIHVRHGHHGHDGGGPAQWAAVIALIVLVLFAAAGHKEIGVMMREVLTGVEIAACVTAGTAALAVAVLIVHVRRVARRDGARPAAPVPLRPAYRVRVVPGEARPALGAARPRTGRWPLPGQWQEITPDIGDRKEN